MSIPLWSGRVGASIKIVVRGEITSATATRLHAVVGDLLAGGAPAVLIDCTATPGLTGHLMGVLQRLARSRPGAHLGVAIDAESADPIGRYVPGLLTAPTTAQLVDAFGIEGDVARIDLVTLSRTEEEPAS